MAPNVPWLSLFHSSTPDTLSLAVKRMALPTSAIVGGVRDPDRDESPPAAMSATGDEPKVDAVTRITVCCRIIEAFMHCHPSVACR